MCWDESNQPDQDGVLQLSAQARDLLTENPTRAHETLKYTYFCLLSWTHLGCLLFFVKMVTQYFVINYYASDSPREVNLVLFHTFFFSKRDNLCISSGEKGENSWSAFAQQLYVYLVPPAGEREGLDFHALLCVCVCEWIWRKEITNIHGLLAGGWWCIGILPSRVCSCYMWRIWNHTRKDTPLLHPYLWHTMAHAHTPEWLLEPHRWQTNPPEASELPAAVCRHWSLSQLRPLPAPTHCEVINIFT